MEEQVLVSYTKLEELKDEIINLKGLVKTVVDNKNATIVDLMKENERLKEVNKDLSVIVGEKSHTIFELKKELALLLK